MAMSRLTISKGGQVSVPAAVRHRWKTRTVVAEDHGSYLVIRPVPDDPIAAARGALREHVARSASQVRAQARRDEAAAERRR